MAQTQVQTPDGSTITVEHPDGASDADILSFAQQNHTPTAVGPDIVKSIAAAPRKVMEGIAGLPGTMQQGVNAGMDYLLGPMPKQSQEAVNTMTGQPLTHQFPTPQDIQEKTSQYLGPSYQPQTTPGKYAGAITEGVTGAVAGPGSIIPKLLMGAAAGAGSEAGQQYSPDHPIIGALAGGLAGGIGTGLAGKGVEAAKNYVAANAAGRNIGTILGAQPVPAGAVRRVGSSMEQDQVTLPGAIATQAKLGPNETMIMDLGRQLQGRAEQMAVQPGAAQNTVLNAVEGRTGQYGSGAAQRIAQTLDQHLGQSQDTVKLIDAVDQLVQSKAGPAYQQVMQKYPNISIPMDIMQRPAVADAMNKAEGIAANYGKKVSTSAPSLEYWDYVKKGMDQRINTMMKSGMDDLSSSQKADLGGLLDAKNTLVQHLDAVTQGEYANARQIASTKPELHDALDFGRSIFNSKLLPEEVAAHIGSMSLPAQAIAQVGARRELERTLGNVRNEGAKARAFLDTNNNMQKISNLFGPQAAQAISDRVAAENTFQQATENVARNSRTAVRTELAKDTANPQTGDMRNTLFGTLEKPVMAGIGYLRNQGMENTRSGIANILTAKQGSISPIVEQLLNYNTKRAANQSAPLGQQSKALARALMSQQLGQ